MKVGNELLWVVELDQSNGNMSVSTLSQAINRNVEIFLKSGSLDLIPIAISNSGKEAHNLIEKLKAKDKQVLDLQAMKWKELEIH